MYAHICSIYHAAYVIGLPLFPPSPPSVTQASFRIFRKVFSFSILPVGWSF